MTDQSPILNDYELIERYTRTEGRVFLTGTQAIVRIVMDQARRDRAQGLDTRGYVSGYRGSPVGGIDLEMSRNMKLVAELGIEFLPAVNEEFGATQMIGTQQVESDPDKKCLAVFGLWYGKGPGVDRAADRTEARQCLWGVSQRRRACRCRRRPRLRVVLDAASIRRRLHEFLHADDQSREHCRVFGPSRNGAMRCRALPACGSVSRPSRKPSRSGMSFELQPDREFAAPDYAPPETGLHYRWPDLPGATDRRADGGQEGGRARLCPRQSDRPGWNGATRMRGSAS